MKDERKTKKQIIAELETLRQREVEWEAKEAELRRQMPDGNVSAVERKLAVERVRAEAMAMRSSDDLLQVVTVLHQEMEQLAVESEGCTIAFMDEENNRLRVYSSHTHPLFMEVPNCEIVNGSRSVYVYEISLDEEDWKPAASAWRKKKVDSFTGSVTVDLWHQYLTRRGAKGDLSKYDLTSITGEFHISNVPFEYGTIGFNERVFREDSVAIVQELAQGLSLGFLRFLDFQRLEEQNRQLTVERGLERIRAEVALMKESQDLFRIIGSVGETLKEFGVPCEGSTFSIVDEAAQEARFYTPDGFLSNVDLSGPISEGATQLLEHWRKGKVYSRFFPSDHPRKRFRNKWLVEAPFPNGNIGMGKLGPEPFSEEDIHLLQRCAEVVSLGYVRFLDFQKLEEQNRRLTVERAFERVRAEVASMKESRDLLKVIGVIEESLRELGVPCERISILIFDEEIDRYGIFSTNSTDWETNLHEMLQRHEGVRELYDYWQKGETWHRFHGEESHLPNLTVVDIPFSYGTVAMSKPGPDPFSEEDIHLLERCKEIIALGYTRFLDFQRVDEAQKKLIDELEEELQTAHDMQMDLMPTESPQVEGFNIAGRCIPANHVGGDFFQYFPQDGKLALCMADVTGHAMEAAVPVMMFSGVLKTEMRFDASLDQLFGHLNRTMHDSLDSRTDVCFCMGELDIADRRFRLANAACPYPFLFRAVTGEVEEMQVDAYPLGVRDGTTYTTIETALEMGDRIVFCSDGLIEAGNDQEEIFGFERTAETVRRGCADGLSAEELIDRVLSEVKTFSGETPQEDDQTMVVMARIG